MEENTPQVSEEDKQILMRAKVEGEMADHYEKIIEGMFRWCIFEQDETLDVTMKAFGVDATKLTIEACERVLAKYKAGADDSGD